MLRPLQALVLLALVVTARAACGSPYSIVSPSTVVYNSFLNISHQYPDLTLVRYGGAACTVPYSTGSVASPAK